jgi:hypothetical protein
VVNPSPGNFVCYSVSLVTTVRSCFNLILLFVCDSAYVRMFFVGFNAPAPPLIGVAPVNVQGTYEDS